MYLRIFTGNLISNKNNNKSKIILIIKTTIKINEIKIINKIYIIMMI